MKIKALIRIIIWTVISILLASIFALALAGQLTNLTRRMGIMKYDDTNFTAGSGTIADYGAITGINIEWVGGTVIISKNTAEDEIEIRESAAKQLEEAGISIAMKHICCSAASELYPQYTLDAVRLGRRLYMDKPVQSDGKIKEIASWRGYITAVKERKAGESIGYGGKCVLEKDCLIATLGVGYGDGLQSALCDIHAPVLIKGQRCRIMACCMDQSFADVTGLDCKPSDEVSKSRQGYGVTRTEDIFG